MPGSPNKTIVNALIGTFQREVKPDKLYDTLRKMSADLNKAYEALFDGPLPPVDGHALTNLNAANLTGEIPESFGIAYINKLNIFSRGQKIIEDDELEPFLLLGYGDLLVDPDITPLSYLRTGAIADGDFYISQNAKWGGIAFERDTATDGSLALELAGGVMNFVWYDTVLAAYRKTFKFTGPEISCSNQADLASLSIIMRDANNVIRVGESAAIDTTPVGHFGIPAKVALELPAAGAIADGVIIINKTTNRFCFYHSGLRYYVAGIAF